MRFLSNIEKKASIAFGRLSVCLPKGSNCQKFKNTPKHLLQLKKKLRNTH